MMGGLGSLPLVDSLIVWESRGKTEMGILCGNIWEIFSVVSCGLLTTIEACLPCRSFIPEQDYSDRRYIAVELYFSFESKMSVTKIINMHERFVEKKFYCHFDPNIGSWDSMIAGIPSKAMLGFLSNEGKQLLSSINLGSRPINGNMKFYLLLQVFWI